MFFYMYIGIFICYILFFSSMKLRDILLTGILSLTTLQQDLSPKIDYFVSKNEREVSTLDVNIENNERYIAFTSLENGLDDLQRMASEQMYEEGYAFFPKHNLWIELGYDESFLQEEGFKLRASLRFDYKLLHSLVKRYGYANVYHTHPSLPPSEYVKIEPVRSAPKEKEQTRKNLTSLLGGVNKSNPSMADCEALLDILKRFPKTLSLCDFYVASKNHIAQYEVLNIVSKDNLFDSLEQVKSADTLIVYGPNVRVKVWPRR